MDSATAALLGAGIGGLVSGGINYFNTRQQFKLQEAKEKKQLRRAKLEELVIKLEQRSRHFSERVTYLLSIQPPEKVDLDKFIGDTPFHVEITMLTYIYASELRETIFQELSRISSEFAELANECRDQIDSGLALDRSGRGVAGPLFQKDKELADVFHLMAIKVAELAKISLDE